MPWPAEIARHSLPGIDGKVHVVVIAGKNEDIAKKFDADFERVPTCTGLATAFSLVDEPEGSIIDLTLTAPSETDTRHPCVEPLPEDGPSGRFVWNTFRKFGKHVTLEVATDASWAALNVKKGKPKTERPFYVLDRRLATFMDAADVIVTKPGGSTTLCLF